MARKLTLEEANKKLQKIYPYLTVIKYTGFSNKDSLFYDSDYGNFLGKFEKVFSGKKNHPKRGFLIKSQNSKDPKRTKKRIETNLIKYNSASPFGNKAVREKSVLTIQDRYGVDNPFKVKEFQEKYQQTCFLKYKKNYFLASKVARDRIRETCLIKFKGPAPIYSIEVKNQIESTNLIRYGTNNVMQNKSIALKNFNKRVKNGFINLNPELTSRIRTHKIALNFRKNVLARDEYKCQKCFLSEKLEAHHIYNFSSYPELRFDIKNGLTLCKQCHQSFHQLYGYYHNNLEQIKNYLN